MMPAKIRHFSQSVLSAEAWFCTADELIAAMELVGRNVERFWHDCGSILSGFDATSGTHTKPKESDVSQKPGDDAQAKHNLINQHMMLAGFAIENLCKGHLVPLLDPQEKEAIKAGRLPNKLANHHIADLARSTGITLSEREQDLLDRIEIAVIWRGRYPSPRSYEKISPFIQWEDDVKRIETFLPRLRAQVGAEPVPKS